MAHPPASQARQVRLRPGPVSFSIMCVASPHVGQSQREEEEYVLGLARGSGGMGPSRAGTGGWTPEEARKNCEYDAEDQTWLRYPAHHKARRLTHRPPADESR